MKLSDTSITNKLTLLAVLLIGCGGGGPDEAANADTGAARDAATAVAGPVSTRLADIGDGYIVWESSRSKAWRLWRRDLDSDTAVQLTPDEPGRQHCCAHISPDGQRLTYLSLKGPNDEYPGGKLAGELRLIPSDGGEARVIGPARVHHENRAGVWRDDDRFVYIDDRGRTVEWSRGDGSRRPVLGPSDTYGWLPDPTLTWVTRGQEPTFSRLRSDSIVRAPVLPGCQPYFTHDGRWGIWTGGGGGPIYRLALDSGERAAGDRHPQILLGKNDPRLPEGRRYLYFPMVSRDGRFLTWGASDSEHDHYKADYDVYVAEIDPDTLDLVGDPIRVTDDPATDRYADIHVEPEELGVHRGEAPLTVEWRAPNGGSWSWSSSDGGTAEGASWSHNYNQPGVYTVTATPTEGRPVTGRALVRPAAPPELLGWSLIDDRTLALDFNEAIDTSQARIEGVEATIGGTSHDGRQLTIATAQPVEGPVSLTLVGVRDRAQAANEAKPYLVDIDPALWPVEQPSTLLTWTGVGGWNTSKVGTGEAEAWEIVRRGTAVPTASGALNTEGGWLEFDRELSSELVPALQHTNEFVLEMILRLTQDMDGELLTWGQPSPRNSNLSLFLDGGELKAYIQVKPTSRGTDPPVRAASLKPGWHHLALAFRPGLTTVYVDGELTADLDAFGGGFWHWRERRLRIGGNEGGGRLVTDLQGLALHGRLLTPEQIADSARRALRAYDVEGAETWSVEGQRIAATPVPSLREISPYTEGLVTRRYRLSDPPQGLPAEITVVEWGILDGKVLPEPAANRTLVLQRFADQPALEGLFLANDLGGDELYYTPPG